MSKCIICGREIDKNTHFVIRSRGEEISFFSLECVNKFVDYEERLLRKKYELNRENCGMEKFPIPANSTKRTVKIYTNLFPENLRH